ncbi:hypothetical protein HXX76_002987 [Chlamydomonas incerta]|uniref:Uncharacterized protein n=1 Tax=Chlamydomonas incerta TaxID=51695 RepID=A0A835TPJ3_CHLIN|nr:hypothetical protein HXX76_002987 [Chlamydomonas incerta]|eukprot:KAG2442911.1 hypothetical protein HXX76_002987 [Chlamydomonas incerta]
MLGEELGTVVTRQSGAVDPHGQGPIYVCTTNDALDWVLEQTPRSRRRDLVLFQNGWLVPWLGQNSLRLGGGSVAAAEAEGQAAASGSEAAAPGAGDGAATADADADAAASVAGAGGDEITLVALYMAAGPDGTATDGLRTVASGRWAQHVSHTLSRGGVRCRAVGGADMYGAVVEKLLWASVFWMMSAALGGMNVGDIVTGHRGDVAALTAELLPPLCRQLRGIAAAGAGPAAAEAAAALEAGSELVVDALVEYSLSISSAVPSRDMALAEFRWRNGALLGMGPTPLHVSWLLRAGVPAELLEAHGVAAGAGP